MTLLLAQGTSVYAQSPASAPTVAPATDAGTRFSVERIPLPSDSAPPTSMAGQTASDLWLLAAGTVYHYDGKATRNILSPGCVSMAYPRQEGFAMPYNVSARTIDAESARARRAGPREPGEGFWIDYVAITSGPGGVRVWGNGSQYYVRGGGTEVFSARIVHGREICEASHALGALESIASTREGNFFITSNYDINRYTGPYALEGADGESEGAGLQGLSALESGDAWLWSKSGNATWHGNGWLWELRPTWELSAVYRVAALSAGRAAAIGLRKTVSHTGTSKAVPSPNALALYEDEQWRVMPLSDELLDGKSFEMAAVGPRQFWLFGGAGQFAYFDGAALTFVPAPLFDVSAAHCGSDNTCFVAGSRPKPAPGSSTTPAQERPGDATTPAQERPGDATKPRSAAGAASGPTAAATAPPDTEALLFKVSWRSK